MGVVFVSTLVCSVNVLSMELSYTGSLDWLTRASEHVTVQISYACKTLAGYHCFHLIFEAYLREWTIFFQVFLKKLFLLHCVPLYVCRLCINYQDLSTYLLGVTALRMLLLTFLSHFVIDFLSIEKL